MPMEISTLSLDCHSSLSVIPVSCRTNDVTDRKLLSYTHGYMSCDTRTDESDSPPTSDDDLFKYITKQGKLLL